jgi:hypothetical protein
LTGLVATHVTALVTKIQQEAHWDFTPEIAMGIEYLALVQIAFWRGLARRIQTLDVQK